MRFPVDIHFLSVVDPLVDVSPKGLDIGLPSGTPVVPIAAGSVIYAGKAGGWAGHGADRATRGCLVIIRLDEPVIVDGVHYSFVWYGNLRSVDSKVTDGSNQIKVIGGERIGCSGASDGCTFVNLRLLTERKGVPAKDMSKKCLRDLIWRKSAGGNPDARARLG